MATEVLASIKQLETNADFVDVSKFAGVRLDLRYATENNFLKRNLYGPLTRCYLHKHAAEKLKKAAESLQVAKPGYSLLIFDCLRPRSVQKTMWAFVEGTPSEKYVANPARGSIHNFGMAVDLSVADGSGKEIDMGTEYDFFGPLAEPVLEKKFLKEGKLKADQVENRLLLRRAMTGAGFLHLSSEWWHFDALRPVEVRKSFKIVE